MAGGASLRPRKHPVQRRAVETCACILEAAALILESVGPEAFTTNHVAERAGVSIGSLYQYFPGKEALVIALMRREKERFHDDASASTAEPTARAALARLIGAAVRHQLERPELARLLDIEEARPEAGREVDNASRYLELLRCALSRPDCRLADPAAAADDIALLVRGLVDAAGARRERQAGDLERRVRGAVFGYLDAASPRERDEM